MPSNGILIAGTGPYVIGGLLPDQRNLLSGLNIALRTSRPANDVRIQGNLIGTNAAGTAAIGNELCLLLYTISDSLIRGIDPAARTVISGHQLQTQISGAFSGTRVLGPGCRRCVVHPLGAGGIEQALHARTGIKAPFTQPDFLELDAARPEAGAAELDSKVPASARILTTSGSVARLSVEIA